MKKKDTLLKVAAVISFIIMISSNMISLLKPILGNTIPEITYSYPNLLIPAQYTFSIWGIIYLLLFVFTIYQLGMFFGNHHNHKKEIIDYARIVLIVINLLNIGWIISWVYDYIALATLLVLFALITLYNLSNYLRNEYLTVHEKLLLRLPFSVYYGWITVTTVLNIITLLVSIQWGCLGMTEAFWVVIALIITTFAAAFRTIRNKDLAYCLTIIWAFTGILVKHSDVNEMNGAYPNIIITISIGIAVLLGCAGYLLLLKKEYI